MSLYTLSRPEKSASLKMPAGLKIEESDDITLLAALGNTTVEDVTNRLANDHLAFVAYMNNKPAAFGWMARGKAKIGELNHEFVLPEGNRYLWNFRTLVEYRGRGIYPALLLYIMNNEESKSKRFWIIHAPENKSSLKGIEKAGFEYVGKLYAKSNGSINIEFTPTSKKYRELLDYMDIPLSEAEAASCWNCSSPYLKKRTPECCCTEAGNICADNAMLSPTLNQF